MNNYNSENVSSQENEKKATSKKQRSYIIAKFYEELGLSSKAKSIRSCGNQLQFITNPKTNEKLSVGGLYCHNRFCPICNERKSNRQRIILDDLLKTNERFYKDKAFIFITLTLKNVKENELSSTIDDMFSAVKLFTNTKKSFLSVRTYGNIKRLEITYNQKEDTYHPHFHLLCCVDKNYFKKTNEKYISKDELQNKWQSYLGIDYQPIVDIKKADNNSLLEITKYMMKDTDIKSKEVLLVLDKALQHRRLYTMTGCFHEQLNNAKDDVRTTFEKTITEYKNAKENYQLEIWNWNNQNKCYEVVNKDLDDSFLIDKQFLEDLVNNEDDN